MEEIFKKLFEKFSPSGDRLDKFVSDFSTGLALTLVLNTPNLSNDEDAQIDKLMRDGDITGALKILQSKFSNNEEWEKYVKEQTQPLYDNYVKAVVK